MKTMIPAWVNGTLQPIEKLEVHKRGLRHRAISVFALCDNHVLLQQRALGKYHTPGLWANTCCTHPHWQESTTDCATRRLAEELGLSGGTLTYRDQIEYRADVGNSLIEHEVVDLFTLTLNTRPPLALNKAEVMAVEWVPLNDLRARVAAAPDAHTPWLRIYLAEHSSKIFENL